MYDFAVMWDWVGFAVRWLHVITAIAWIGFSGYATYHAWTFVAELI